MVSRISHMFPLLILAGILIAGCKGTSTDSGTTVTPPPADIGDSIPNIHSSYTYQIAQLDMNGNVIPGTLSPPNHSAIIIATALSQAGKSNVYFVNDDGDTCYYAYESTNDVSIYLQNPGFFNNHSKGENADETLETVLNTVFHHWITLPIATKDTGRIVYNATDTLALPGDHIITKILAKADYIGDSTITVGGTNLLCKHCRVSITAVFDPSRYSITVSHVRDFWFVPKIGYIAKLKTRTNVPYNQFLVQPTDTTAMEKTLASFKLL